MVVHEHLKHFSEAALKCGIVGKEDNYKYLVASQADHPLLVGAVVTGAQPKAGTGHKMQRVSVFSKLHC